MLCQEAIFLTLKSLMLCDCILPTIIDPKHDGTGVPSLKSPHTGLPRKLLLTEMLPLIQNVRDNVIVIATNSCQVFLVF